VRAKKRAAQAAYDAALAAYQQTVLQALQQVADSLSALQDNARELQARDDADQQAQASLVIARRQYDVGGISQTALLDAQRQALQTVIDRTRAQGDQFSNTAALFQSLASGVMETTLGSSR
jgi:outer membrane protein TolC